MVTRLLCLIAVVLAVPFSGRAIESESQQAAVNRAKMWLSLVDEGDGSKSWSEAAGYFRNAVSREQWEQTALSIRNPLGKVLSRKLETVVFRTSLPGAPDGKYMIITFSSSFERKKSAVETVIPMIDEDGEWRVSGYYIK